MIASPRLALFVLGFVVAASSLVFVTPAHAAATDDVQSEIAAKGIVTAELEWTDAQDGTRGVKLKITRAGAVAFDGALVIRGCPEPDCVLAAVVRENRLHIGDIDADGESEVVLYALSDGPRCCILVVLDFDGSTYVQRPLTSGAGLTMRDIDHDDTMEFLSNDDRFTSAFGPSDMSWRPPLTHQLVDGKFVDVTRRFPALIRTDAARARKLARSLCSEDNVTIPTLGFWAGWAGNQYLLGNRPAALRALRAEYRNGCIRPSNRKTLARLDAKLRAWGYARTA